MPGPLLAKQTSNRFSFAMWDNGAFKIAESVGQKSWTLRRGSLSGGGGNIFFIIFSEKCSQYNHYVMISMNSPGIIHSTSLKIVDAALSLILMMQQLMCCLPF